MKLFDEIERNDCELAGYAEPEFCYWNRSGRIEFGRARYELENWFVRYPISGKADLRARFRSEIDSHHRAAFFELFIHELLLKLDYSVTPHPPAPQVTRKPDFLVESSSRERFYVEATIVTNESAGDTAARKRINDVYDVLNRRVESPDFFLWLDVDGTPRTPVPANKLASFLRQRLAEVDADELIRLYGESGQMTAVPQWQFEYDGWKIEFKPIPKKSDARGRPGVRPIGAINHGFQFADHRTPIRDAITDKAGRYGELGVPYVIAVNILEYFVDERDLLEALFGKEEIIMAVSRTTPSDVVETRRRLPDGVWIGPDGHRNTRISGVLMATRLSPWSLSQSNLCVYHNPWAQRPCQAEFDRLPAVIPRDNQIVRIDGQAPTTIFGLPASWPHDVS